MTSDHDPQAPPPPPSSPPPPPETTPQGAWEPPQGPSQEPEASIPTGDPQNPAAGQPGAQNAKPRPTGPEDWDKDPQNDPRAGSRHHKHRNGKHYRGETRTRARELFVIEDQSCEEIARILGVRDGATVRQWAKRYNWHEERDIARREAYEKARKIIEDKAQRSVEIAVGLGNLHLSAISALYERDPVSGKVRYVGNREHAAAIASTASALEKVVSVHRKCFGLDVEDESRKDQVIVGVKFEDYRVLLDRAAERSEGPYGPQSQEPLGQNVLPAPQPAVPDPSLAAPLPPDPPPPAEPPKNGNGSTPRSPDFWLPPIPPMRQ